MSRSAPRIPPWARFLLATGVAFAGVCLLIPEPDAVQALSSGRVPDWTSLLPPVLAVAWAFALGRVLLALLLAIVAGAVILAGGAPVEAARILVVEEIGHTLVAGDTLKILLFTSSLVGLVQVCVASGGIPALVGRLTRGRASRRRTQMTAAVLGTLVFFDDYANTVVVGSAMRPVADRTTTSREKLAFLVDATAAPVAGIAIISTWIGYEIGLFDGQIGDFLGQAPNGYGAFFAVLPFRFYCILTLMLVYILAWTGRDFGPMLRAERRAAAGHPADPSWTLLGFDRAGAASPGVAGPRPAHWIDGLGPIVAVIAGTFVAFVIIGLGRVPEGGSASFVDVFIAGSDLSYDVLAWGGLLGSVLAVVWARLRTGLAVSHALAAFLRGVRVLLPTLAVLVLAMTMRKLTQDLGTGNFLAALLGGVPAALLPIAVFTLSAAVAFTTGSSWATMGLLVPVALPLARAAVEAGADPVVILATAGSVLDGAIFGDHCSPISDTTVMSSAASGCDHLAHVRTQLPYAMLGMGVALCCGYGLTVATASSPALGYGVGFLVLLLTVRFLGRKP